MAGHRLDVGDYPVREAFHDLAAGRHGVIDGLANEAGIARGSSTQGRPAPSGSKPSTST